MSIVGEPISKEVIKQLKVREKALSTTDRSDYYQRFLLSKNVWIRMISGVDTVANGTKEAEYFVLSNGSQYWDGKKFNTDSNIKFFNNDESNNPGLSRYTTTANLGVRPHPGITGLQITSKNTYGTIREAEIKFSIWSREQLELAHRLFLRPGFPLIVEWGNSIYIDSKDGDKLKEYIQDIDSVKTFFTSGKDFKSVSDKIYQNKEKYAFNYDGFVGLITNFSFSLNSDGGYECSVTAVTYGSILESLTIKAITAGTETDRRTLFALTLDFLEQYASSNFPYIGFLTTQAGQSATFSSFILDTLKDEGKEDNENLNLTKSAGSLVFKTLKSNLENPSQLGFNFISFESYDGYISLRMLLGILNSTFILNNPVTGAPLSTTFELNQPNRYLTFPEHFSLDPSRVVLPKKTNFEEEIVLRDGDGPTPVKELITLKSAPLDGNSGDRNQIDLIDKMNSLNWRPGGSEGDSVPYDSEYIYNLRIGIKYLKDLYREQISTSQELTNSTVLDFLKSILDDINENLGRINELDYYFDEERLTFNIVDRAINPSVNANTIDVPVINLSGLRSTITEVDIRSEISSQLASEIAISATSPASDSPQSRFSMVEWNAGLTPRFEFKEYGGNVNNEVPIIRPKDESFLTKTKRVIRKSVAFIKNNTFAVGLISPTVGLVFQAYKIFQLKRGPTTTATETFLSDVARLYDGFWRERRNGKEIDIELQASLKSSFFKTMQIYLNLHTSFSDKRDVFLSNKPIIPVKISLTMDGISGLKVGQSFRINEPRKDSIFLPSTYNSYGFLITGLNSSVSQGKWITNLEGLTYLLDKTYNDRDLDQAQQELS